MTEISYLFCHKLSKFKINTKNGALQLENILGFEMGFKVVPEYVIRDYCISHNFKRNS